MAGRCSGGYLDDRRTMRHSEYPTEVNPPEIIMFVVLLLLCVLMVVGAGVCLIAILGMWDKPQKPDSKTAAKGSPK